MKITQTIKVQKDNIEKLKQLPCVQQMSYSGDGRVIRILLRDDMTHGNRVVKDGDYLCKYANGLWQRYGSEALDRYVKAPSDEINRY